MPAQFVIDCESKIALSHYASGRSDIPGNAAVLELIGKLEGCPAA